MQRLKNPIGKWQSKKHKHSRRSKDQICVLHDDGTFRRYAYPSTTKPLEQCDTIFDLKQPISVTRIKSGIRIIQNKKDRSFDIEDSEYDCFDAIQREIAKWKKPEIPQVTFSISGIELFNSTGDRMNCPVNEQGHIQWAKQERYLIIKKELKRVIALRESLWMIKSPQVCNRLDNKIADLTYRVDQLESQTILDGTINIQNQEICMSVNYDDEEIELDLSFEKDKNGEISCYDCYGNYWRLNILFDEN